MSLFGADGVFDRESVTSENDFQNPSTVAPEAPQDTASAASVEPSSPVIADDFQNAQPVSYTTYDVDDDDYDFEDDSEDDDAVHGPPRPNRFIGKAPTWHGYTAADRNIVASLEQIQSGDLSAHLYNAHALRRRIRLPQDQLSTLKDWTGKDSWLKKGKELRFTDIMGEIQTELVPSKRWAAWPLPAGEVPMAGERFDRLDSNEMMEDDMVQEAGCELREEMLAIFLKLAKERVIDRSPGGRLLSRSKGANSDPSIPIAASDTEDSDCEIVVIKEDGETASQAEAGKVNKSGNPQPVLKTTVLADDGYAQRVLEPSINSLLAHIDRVAAGIRRTRVNHFGRGGNSDTSGSEGPSDIESRRSGSRSVSRSVSRSLSRTRSRSASTQKQPSRASSRAPSKAKKAPTLKPHEESRKPSVPLDDDESASDFGQEFEAKKARGSQRSGSVSSEQSTASISSATQEASVQSGLMDWSEVLGIASMSGWNEKAIARTAQRCAALFGEGMAFRPFDEGLATEPISQPIQYTPASIPAPDLQDPRSITTKRPFYESGTLRCPHTDCPHHHEDSKIAYRVIEHVKRVHGYDPRTNDAENEERKYGGVHIDGFLLPVAAKKGWLGGGRSKSKSVAPTKPGRKQMKEENTPVVLSSSPS